MERSFSPVSLNYFSPNLSKGIEYLIPQFYFEDDYTLSGKKIDLVDAVLSGHLALASQISSILQISTASLTGTIFSSLNTISGISNYFVIQNKLTEITSEKFEKNVLAKLNKAFEDFSTSSTFRNYVSSTFIPGIRLNTPSLTFDGITNTHQFLIENLSWIYFLNSSGHGNLTFDASTALVPLISDLYNQKKILLPDSIKVLNEYLWKNKDVCSTFKSYIPQDQLQSSNGLDNLNTLTEILYSPLFLDYKNYKVRNAFQSKFTNTYEPETNINGPFARLIKAFSFSFANIGNEIDKLAVLYDIQECPDEYLPELAKLIGWRLFGFDPARWRLQLANAVDIYKRAGTKQSLQVAVNSLFSQDVFNLSSNIFELWESYLPNLAYYALGTDSSAFTTKTWTRSLASKLGVSGYSTSSMDENLRMAVDAIILTLVVEFPDHFALAGNSFPINDPDFRFFYRGRVMPIPPWEEYPYYTNAQITGDLIDRFADLLACFGVREEFALNVRQYILENTLLATDDIREGNGWLIFTSGATTPPNLDYVSTRIGEKNLNALNAWSNKSSHFKLILDSADFDFTKGTFDSDSYHALREVSRVVNEFSPAHAIPDIRVNANATDSVSSVDYTGITVILDPQDGYFNLAISSRPTKGLTTYENVASHTRLEYPSATFWRDYYDTISDSPFTLTAVIDAPRVAFRRRDMSYGFTINGYYSRTGYNMPISWETSTLEYSLPSSLGFLPLGYIPSAGRYENITDVHNLPTVYRYCNRAGSAVFSGVPISATFPCRGINTTSISVNYVDRGQLPDLFAIAHKLTQKENYILAEKAIDSNISAYISDFYWKNVAQSYANQYFTSLLARDDREYLWRPFGKEINRLYRIWIRDFSGHALSKNMFEANGPTIFAHAYGSILENSDFYKPGNIFGNYPELEASSPVSLVKMNKSNVFKTINNYNTTVHTAASAFVVSSFVLTSNPPAEYRNSSFYSGVELVFPAHISNNNYFSFFELSPLLATEENEYFVDNSMLIMKSYQDMQRIRYPLKQVTYSSEEGYALTNNFLSPDHYFRFRTKGVVVDDTGEKLGGVTLGLWIHTGFEGDTFYTYTGEDQWVMCSKDQLSQENVISWAHKYTIPLQERNLDSPSGIKKLSCLALKLNPSKTNPILTIQENEFVNFDVEFHTKNIFQELTPDYVRSYGSLHKKSQDYIFELFIVPDISNKDKVFILDHVDLLDLTLEQHTKYKTTYGTYTGKPFNAYCPVSSIQLTEDELQCLFLEYKNYEDSFGSRNPSADVNESIVLGPAPILRIKPPIYQIQGYQGGSRLNYRTHPSWVGATGTGDYYSSILINN